MLKLAYQAWTTEEGKAHNEAVNATRKLYEEAKAALIAAHKENNSPKATVEATIATIGYEMAEAIIATLINGKAWDGRISDRNKEWAASIDGCLDHDTARLFRASTDAIHPAHLDQIANAMRNAERPEEPEDPKMNPNKNTIEEIEAMTEAEATTYAEGQEEIKGYNLYFVDFGGYHGLSALARGSKGRSMRRKGFPGTGEINHN